MTNAIEVSFEEDAWKSLPFEELSTRAIGLVFDHLKISHDWEISILACNDAKIRSLNVDFRDKDKTTNVLSWPNFELPLPSSDTSVVLPEGSEFGDESLGDIAIAYETVVAEARDENKPIEDHFTHLMIHGVLHLLGFDHIEDKDATIMQGLESRLLAKLGINDPYG